MKVGLLAKIKALIKKLLLTITKPIQWLVKLFSTKKSAPQNAEQTTTQVTPKEPKFNKILKILSTAAKILKNPLANAVSFLATKVFPWFKKSIRKLFEKPAASIIAGAGIFASSSLLPTGSPFVLILRGTGIATSGIGFLRSFPKQINKALNFYKIASSIGRAANTFSTFLAGLTTASASASLPAWIFILPIALLAGLTLFTVFTSSAAFLPEGVGETPPHIGTLVACRTPGQRTHLAEEVICNLVSCGISEINKDTWYSTLACLDQNNIKAGSSLIQEFYYSVFSVGTGPKYKGLQCVGFVKGIMAEQGKPITKNNIDGAQDYLNLPPPTNYQIITDMSKVEKGDLVIMRGETYGHIAIVIDKIGDQIRVAEAIGTKNGLIQIEDINPVYYDGFLRPL